MSADLFAQFGSFSGSSNSQAQAGNAQAQPAADDPFAFLSAALAQPSQPAQPSQQASPPPLPAHTQPQPTWQSFGVPLQPSQSSLPAQPALNWGAASTWGGSTTPVTAQPAAAANKGAEAEDDDAWGDFEEASPGTLDLDTLPGSAPQPHFQFPPQPAAVPPPQPPQPPQPQNRHRVRAPTLDILSNSLISFGDAAPPATSATSAPRPPPLKPSPAPLAQQRQPWMTKAPKPSNSDVLFDADNIDPNESFDEDDEDDDEFGDFETGQSSLPQPSVAPSRAMSRPPAPAASSASTRPVAKPAPAATTALIDLLSLSEPDPVPAASSPSLPLDKSFATLGFGEQKPASSGNSQAASHLAPLNFGSTALAPAELPQTPRSPSFQNRNPFPGLAVTTPLSAQFPIERVKNRTPSPVTNWPTFDSPPSFSKSPKKATAKKASIPQVTESDWDAWDLVDTATAPPATAKAKVAAVTKPEPSTSDWDWGAGDQSKQDSHPAVDLPSAIANAPAAKTIPDNAPPPTNVPPPAILLSLFPTLMALPDEALFRPIASQPVEVRNRVLGDPKTIAFLRNYLQIIVVAVRVIAGRRQRWHRDKFLAQSMSISAAGSSRGGGMKLAGIDKTQNQREDREAADVVAAWRRYVGKLRSAVATANAALVAAEAAEHKHYPPLKIPDLQSETVPVTTAKQVPTAPRPCVICGLKRDERVRGVDGDDVQDLFGEWWVEHWGHRACRNFWVEHEATLRSK